MEYHIISKNFYREDLFQEIASLHYNALSYRSIITLFGEDFLASVYEIIVKKDEAFIVVAMNDDLIAGFVCGVVDNSKITKSLFLSFHRLVRPTVRAVLKYPFLITKSIEMLRYSTTFSRINSELLSIVVIENFRNSGIGKRLVKEMEREFINRGILSYQVTVHREMVESNNFYEGNGMILANKFIMFNTEWNLWEKYIIKDAP